MVFAEVRVRENSGVFPKYQRTPLAFHIAPSQTMQSVQSDLQNSLLSPAQSILATTGTGLVNVLLPVLAVRLLDRTGRLLLLIGIAGMIAGLEALGSIFCSPGLCDQELTAIRPHARPIIDTGGNGQSRYTTRPKFSRHFGPKAFDFIVLVRIRRLGSRRSSTIR
jgi:MFS family permease